MTSPSKKESSARMDEVPLCTICHDHLSNNLSCLACGHIFHTHCITQQFEYKRACPNCQKAASQKQMRSLFFEINKRFNPQVEAILANLDSSEQKQLDFLLEEIRKITDANQRLKNTNSSQDKTIKSQNATTESLRAEVHKQKGEMSRLMEENMRLITENRDLDEQLSKHLRMEMKMRVELEKLKSEEREFQKMRTLSRIITERSQEIVQFKQQLEDNKTPPEDMAKTFFDMLLMKNLEMLRMKERLKEFPDRLNEHEMEVSCLKNNVATLKKELKDANDRKAVQRKKYEQLKLKYRTLSERAKQKGMKEYDIPEMQESQGFATVAKGMNIPDITNLETTMRKPFFNPSGMATIGGFGAKKKDDRMVW